MSEKISIREFLTTDCQLAKPIEIFYGIYQATGGDPCTTGCAYFDGGKCPAYRVLTIPSKASARQDPHETVRETAARLGISISEVRRMRKRAP